MNDSVLSQIISHPNNLFEIMSKEPVKRERNLHNRVQSKRTLIIVRSREPVSGTRVRGLLDQMKGRPSNTTVTEGDTPPCCVSDSDYETANRTADVDVELMAFQSIIGDDYKGHDPSESSHRHTHTQNGTQTRSFLLIGRW